MSQLFIEGYSEYELEALKIPSNLKTKCLHQLVDYTKCQHKAGVLSALLNNACEDELAKFSRCHQRSVNYYSVGYAAQWKSNNPSAFNQDNVSPTLQTKVYSPTPLNFHRH